MWLAHHGFLGDNRQPPQKFLHSIRGDAAPPGRSGERENSDAPRQCQQEQEQPLTVGAVQVLGAAGGAGAVERSGERLWLCLPAASAPAVTPN